MLYDGIDLGVSEAEFVKLDYGAENNFDCSCESYTLNLKYMNASPGTYFTIGNLCLYDIDFTGTHKIEIKKLIN